MLMELFVKLPRHTGGAYKKWTSFSTLSDTQLIRRHCLMHRVSAYSPYLHPSASTTMPNNHEEDNMSAATSNGQKHSLSNALELGLCKRPTTQDPLVHHGCHFGHAVHTFCNVQTLITNGLLMMGEHADQDLESTTALERKEYTVFRELLRMVPGLEMRLMQSSEEEVIVISDLIQKGANGARADDTKGMKSVVIDWITPKGQTLNPHIPRNVKSGRGFNHERTGALLCPAGLDWANSDVKMKLVSGQIQVAGDQWPIFLYANYTYDPEDPWNGLLQSGILVSAFKHIFTSPSSVDQEPKATQSGNAQIHRMWLVTKASIAYIATQARFALSSAQVFSRTDLVTDSEHFYTSIIELLDEKDEKDEVDQLLIWWNRQVFPLYSKTEWLPSKNSALARIRLKRTEYKEQSAAALTD
ncbi:hypothetical protein HYDPIDRAFT_32833 [Hydnomerulius pinastri MD-312]|uniref:Unplaced genomic scaffold scaffold_46, whole genome shotgun sequence n=1 Tax=Hydnomerulius pinastri MD-312 TaxID=994086 RepID=A0A0C9W9C5_9AGAM|nr:hypothetical protein HYDPIDRAFT_32833 [Hydnomerulius pinastri MD-312]